MKAGRFYGAYNAFIIFASHNPNVHHCTLSLIMIDNKPQPNQNIMGDAFQPPSSYQIADAQRIRGFLPSQVKASPAFRPIGQSIEQTKGLKKLENYEDICYQKCEASRTQDIKGCVRECLQQVSEQTRVG
jgi:hypothetical protein